MKKLSMQELNDALLSEDEELDQETFGDVFIEGWNYVEDDLFSYEDLIPDTNGFGFELANRPGEVFWSMDEAKAVAEYEWMSSEGYAPYWFCGKEEPRA